MERSMEHDFYLLKAKKKLDLKSGFYSSVLTTEETASYLCLDTFWIPHEFMEYIAPSLSGLNKMFDYTGISLITEQADAEKLVRICEGWIMVIQEMEKFVLIGDGDWETGFPQEDLLLWIKKLKDAAEQMQKHENYVILHFGP